MLRAHDLAPRAYLITPLHSNGARVETRGVVCKNEPVTQDTPQPPVNRCWVQIAL